MGPRGEDRFLPLPWAPPIFLRRYIFCCTFLRVASTGRYPASCPAKPGLSSVFQAIVCPARNTKEEHIIIGEPMRSYVKNTTSDKFPYQRIVRKSLAGHAEEIIKELEKPLGFVILRIFLADAEKQRLRKKL